MSNDKTEQPIPAEELDRIAGDALYNCPKDAPAGSEAGRWKHGYIQGGKAEYARAHSLPPSPLGEAGPKWVKASERLPEGRPGWSNSENVNICWQDQTGALVVSTGSYSYQQKKWMDYLYPDRKEEIVYWQRLPAEPVKDTPVEHKDL